MFLIAEHVRSESFDLSLIFAASIDGRASETLQRVLASNHISAADIAPLRISDVPSYRDMLKRACLMKEAILLDAFKQACDGKLDFFGSYYCTPRCLIPWQFPPVYRVFLFNGDLAAFRRLAQNLEDIAAVGPYREARDRAVAFDHRVCIEPEAELCIFFMLPMASNLEVAASADARRRVAQLGLALYRYRAKNSHYPKKLDELTPDYLRVVPKDPFDDKPLWLKRTKRGLVVYSIGPDMTDNGGMPFDETRKTGDIVLELPNGSR